MPRANLSQSNENSQNRQNSNDNPPLPTHERRTRIQRTISYFFSNGLKNLIYPVGMLLGGAFGASLGLGFWYALATALATPFAMDIGNRITNPVLNYLFPRERPRTSGDVSNALVMTITLAVTLTLGLGMSWSAGLLFLSPLALKSSLILGWRSVEYFFPSIRSFRTNLETTILNARDESLVDAIRNDLTNNALNILANVENQRVEILMRALEESVATNNLEVFNQILSRPTVSQHLARENNRLFINACYHGRTEMVTALLRHQEVRNAANINNNAALRYACRENHINVVRALLTSRRVRNGVSYNHFEALRLAQANDERHQNLEIAALLFQIPAVANAILPDESEMRINLPAGAPTNAEPVALRDIAQNRENAMAQLRPEQQQALGVLQDRHRTTLNSRGREAILAEIRNYLIAEYNKKPAIHHGRRLPLDFNVNLTNDEKRAYHLHKVHAAYRCLFLNPNPWTVGGNGQANINLDHKETICLIWLAINDPNQELPEDFTRPRTKKQLAEALYHIGRAHNWDRRRPARNGGTEEYDDGEPDRPSCGMGVMQRLMDIVQLLLNSNAQTRPISAEIIVQKFKEELVTENENEDDNNMYRKLSRLSRADLESFEESFGYVTGADEGEPNQNLLNQIKPTKAEVDAFIDQCKTYFGASRITATGQNLRIIRNINLRNQTYDTYEAYIRAIAENVFIEFAPDINSKIQDLKNPKKNNDKDSNKNKSKAKTPEKTKAKVVTFSEQSKAHTSSSKSKNNRMSGKNASKNKSTTYHPKPRITKAN